MFWQLKRLQKHCASLHGGERQSTAGTLAQLVTQTTLDASKVFVYRCSLCDDACVVFAQRNSLKEHLRDFHNAVMFSDERVSLADVMTDDGWLDDSLTADGVDDLKTGDDDAAVIVTSERQSPNVKMQTTADDSQELETGFMCSICMARGMTKSFKDSKRVRDHARTKHPGEQPEAVETKVKRQRTRSKCTPATSDASANADDAANEAVAGARKQANADVIVCGNTDAGADGGAVKDIADGGGDGKVACVGTNDAGDAKKAADDDKNTVPYVSDTDETSCAAEGGGPAVVVDARDDVKEAAAAAVDDEMYDEALLLSVDDDTFDDEINLVSDDATEPNTSDVRLDVHAPAKRKHADSMPDSAAMSTTAPSTSHARRSGGDDVSSQPPPRRRQRLGSDSTRIQEDKP